MALVDESVSVPVEVGHRWHNRIQGRARSWQSQDHDDEGRAIAELIEKPVFAGEALCVRGERVIGATNDAYSGCETTRAFFSAVSFDRENKPKQELML